MKHKRKEWSIKIWSDGNRIDLWSLNHFLAGCVIASISVLSSVPFWTSIIILFFLLFFWEVYEILKKFHETISNKVLDIALGLIGYIVIYIVMKLEIFNNIILFLITIISLTLLCLWGWIAYKMGSSDDFLTKFKKSNRLS